MPIIARAEPPVDVPPNIPQREFFAAILNLQATGGQARQGRPKIAPPREGQIPPVPPEWMWHCFFLAARAMACKEKRRSLLLLWDLRAAQFALALVNAPDDEELEHPVGVEALKDLLTIMLDPEAAKESAQKKYPLVAIFEGARRAFRYCRDLRRRLGSHGRYELMPRQWPVPVPAKALPTDSPEFYRLALCQVFGTGELPWSRSWGSRSPPI